MLWGYIVATAETAGLTRDGLPVIFFAPQEKAVRSPSVGKHPDPQGDGG